MEYNALLRVQSVNLIAYIRMVYGDLVIAILRTTNLSGAQNALYVSNRTYYNFLLVKIIFPIKNIIVKAFYVILGPCKPYTESTCRLLATKMEGIPGGRKAEFAEYHNTKGCFAFKKGYYKGSYFYGLGGNENQTSEPFYRDATVFRPQGYDCTLGSKLYHFIISCWFTQNNVNQDY